MEVFTLSRGSKIGRYILFSISLIIFSGAALDFCFGPSLTRGTTVILLALFVFIGLIFRALLQVNEKIILDNYGVRKKSRLADRELRHEDIKGYIVDEDSLIINPHKGKGKSIQVSKDINGVDVLQRRLAVSHPDLNALRKRGVL